MTREQLLSRIVATPGACGGNSCIRGTRIYVSIILDSLAEGMTPEQIVDHFSNLQIEDIQAAIAYAAELSRENLWKVTTG